MTLTAVTAKYLNADDSAAGGTVEFQLSAAVYDSDDHAIRPQTKLTATLDGTGALSADLLAYDDPGLSLTGTLTYRVVERIIGAPHRVYFVAVPVGGTVDLGALAPQGAPYSVTALGAPSGVATLGPDGKLTANQRPTIGVDSVNGSVGAVTLDAADVGAEAAGAVATQHAADIGTFRAGPQMWDDYRGLPDGTITTPRNGPAYSLYSNGNAAAALRVVSGALTYAPVAAGAGYGTVLLDLPAKRVGATFKFGAYTTDNGSAVVGAFAQDPAVTLAGSGTVPDSPCHMVITPTGWQYGVWSGNSITIAASGTFATPLTVGQVYAVEVVLDQQNAAAFVMLPDGTTTKVTHSLIGSVSASYAFIECYRPAATDSISAFVTAWADGRVDDWLPLAQAVHGAAAPQQTTLQYAPAANPFYVAPINTMTAVDTTNLRQMFTVPESGRYRVDLYGYVQLPAACEYYWGVMSGATILISDLVVNAPAAVTQLVPHAITHVLTGIPGTVLTLDWSHFATASSAAVLQASQPAGLPLVMTLTPL